MRSRFYNWAKAGVKSACTSIKNATVRGAVQVSFQLGKLVQSLGSAGFGGIAIAAFGHRLSHEYPKTITEEDLIRKPATPYILAIWLLGNALSTWDSRLPGIRHQVKKIKLNKKNCKPRCLTRANPCNSVRNSFSNLFRMLAWLSARFSAICTIPNTTFFSLKVTTIVQHACGSDGDSVGEQAAIWLFVGYVTISNLLSYISITLNKSDETAEKFAGAIAGPREYSRLENKEDEENVLVLSETKESAHERRKKTCRKITTGVLVSVNAIPIVAFAYLSTTKATQSLPGLRNIPLDYTEPFVYASTVTAGFSSVLSNSDGLYNTLECKRQTERADDPRWFFWPGNILDSLSSGVANTISIALLLEDWFGADPYAPEILAASGALGLLSSVLNGIFSHEAVVRHRKEDRIQRKQALDEQKQNETEMRSPSSSEGEKTPPEEIEFKALPSPEESALSISEAPRQITENRHTNGKHIHQNGYALLPPDSETEYTPQKSTSSARASKLGLFAIPELTPEEKELVKNAKVVNGVSYYDAKCIVL